MSASTGRARGRTDRAWCSLLCIIILGGAPLFATATAGAQSAPAELASKLQVQDAWIRWLPSGLPEGGYVTLINRSAEPLVLIGASSDAYGQIALHQSSHDGGMSRMATVDKITIAAHSKLSFAAEGYHLMLMQPRAALAPGAHVSVTLKFAGGESEKVEFELLQPNATGPRGQDMGDMPKDMKDMKGMKDMPGMPH